MIFLLQGVSLSRGVVPLNSKPRQEVDLLKGLINRSFEKSICSADLNACKWPEDCADCKLMSKVQYGLNKRQAVCHLKEEVGHKRV